MTTYLNVVQVLISVVIVLVILTQVKEAGGGLFGSAQSTFRTRRGLEKTLFQFTIILAAVFLIVSILSVSAGDKVWDRNDTVARVGAAVAILGISLAAMRLMK